MRALFAIACVLVGPAARADVGIGVSATSDDATIYVPVVASRFMFEPYVRYFEHEDQFSNRTPASGPDHQEIENAEVGVGIFRLLQPRERVTVYYGGRLAYAQQRFESTSTDLFSGSGAPELFVQRTELDGYSIVPSLGLTYSVIERLSIGVEVGWFHSELEGQELIDPAFGPATAQDHEFTENGTRSRFIVRFFF